MRELNNTTRNAEAAVKDEVTINTGEQSKARLNIAQSGDNWMKKVAGLGSLVVLGGAWLASNALAKST